jgi:hypothetical protein
MNPRICYWLVWFSLGVALWAAWEGHKALVYLQLALAVYWASRLWMVAEPDDS